MTYDVTLTCFAKDKWRFFFLLISTSISTSPHLTSPRSQSILSLVKWSCSLKWRSYLIQSNLYLYICLPSVSMNLSFHMSVTKEENLLVWLWEGDGREEDFERNITDFLVVSTVKRWRRLSRMRRKAAKQVRQGQMFVNRHWYFLLLMLMILLLL